MAGPHPWGDSAEDLIPFLFFELRRALSADGATRHTLRPPGDACARRKTRKIGSALCGRRGPSSDSSSFGGPDLRFEFLVLLLDNGVELRKLLLAPALESHRNDALSFALDARLASREFVEELLREIFGARGLFEVHSKLLLRPRFDLESTFGI